MRLMACRVSGKVSSRDEFQTKLQKSFCSRGPRVHTNNMNPTLRDGLDFVVNGKLIALIHL